MITHFKDTMRMNIAKIVGNLDIIGNPVSLFSNVAGGFKAVYQKPKEGFVKGPLEGVVGIGTGSATLLKATTTSAFKAVSKMTNSIASGLTSLAMDEKYLKERNLYRASKP
jgi:vacuolar protein sorting-associated protein 13A/C